MYGIQKQSPSTSYAIQMASDASHDPCVSVGGLDGDI